MRVVGVDMRQLAAGIRAFRVASRIVEARAKLAIGLLPSGNPKSTLNGQHDISPQGNREYTRAACQNIHGTTYSDGEPTSRATVWHQRLGDFCRGLDQRPAHTFGLATAAPKQRDSPQPGPPNVQTGGSMGTDKELAKHSDDKRGE